MPSYHLGWGWFWYAMVLGFPIWYDTQSYYRYKTWFPSCQDSLNWNDQMIHCQNLLRNRCFSASQRLSPPCHVSVMLLHISWNLLVIRTTGLKQVALLLVTRDHLNVKKQVKLACLPYAQKVILHQIMHFLAVYIPCAMRPWKSKVHIFPSEKPCLQGW